ncbi:MAG TPA: topoisomerase DNA-binding C4 zinc finger domain-containing protein [archaeon]|nr:topoisomerase DNA-binding C4 zinc finger domain-containing protein [archaeon]
MKCAVCGKTATIYNKQKQPVCSAHSKTAAKAPMCPQCGLAMVVRQGKWGSFWGCMAFPACDGIRKI